MENTFWKITHFKKTFSSKQTKQKLKSMLSSQVYKQKPHRLSQLY